MNDDLLQQLLDDYLFFTIFIIIGIIDLFIIGLIKYSRNKKQQNWQQAFAEVTAIHTSRGNRGSVMHHPVFTFTTYTGQVVMHQSTFGSTPSYYQVGDRVEIFYNPAKPQAFIVKNDKRLKLVFTLITGIALVFLIISIIGLYPFLQENFLNRP